jgi:hypothetical protein
MTGGSTVLGCGGLTQIQFEAVSLAGALRVAGRHDDAGRSRPPPPISRSAARPVGDGRRRREKKATVLGVSAMVPA